jgi:hypothetical protein
MRPLFFVGALGLAGIGAAVLSDYFAHYEEPNYKTDTRDGSFELRSYPSVIAASVQVSGNDDVSANNAFKILAGYIFGKNKGSKKLAMTTPVVREASSQKIAMTVPVTVEKLNMSMTMSFYMPAEYTLDTLPEPFDKRIELTQIPSRKFAVMRFTGFADEKNCLQKEEELKRWLESRNLKGKGQALRAFYNPPWTLPFLRRNEIWIPL